VADKLNGHSAFADVDGLSFETGRGSETFNWNLNCDSHLLAPLTLHQGADCSETGLGAFDGQGLVQNEMGSHVEAAFEADGRFHKHDAQGPLIDRGRFSTTEDVASFFGIHTIDDNGFEALAGDEANGVIAGGAMFDVNFEVAEDPPEDTNCLFVGTQ
jgi:hypothetical protein